MNDVNHFQSFMDGAIPQTLVITSENIFWLLKKKKLDGNHFQSPINNVHHVWIIHGRRSFLVTNHQYDFQ